MYGFHNGIVTTDVLVVGILGSLAVTEGLYHFGSFVSAFDGADSPFYMSVRRRTR